MKFEQRGDGASGVLSEEDLFSHKRSEKASERGIRNKLAGAEARLPLGAKDGCQRYGQIRAPLAMIVPPNS